MMGGVDGKQGKTLREKNLPFAKIPSNCFLARVASAAVSKVIKADPWERPLRSYFVFEFI